MKLLIKRANDSVVVQIMRNKRTGLYSFVNLTKGHICGCEFTTIQLALMDIENDTRVLSWCNLEDKSDPTTN